VKNPYPAQIFCAVPSFSAKNRFRSCKIKDKSNSKVNYPTSANNGQIWGTQIVSMRRPPLGGFANCGGTMAAVWPGRGRVR